MIGVHLFPSAGNQIPINLLTNLYPTLTVAGIFQHPLRPSSLDSARRNSSNLHLEDPSHKILDGPVKPPERSGNHNDNPAAPTMQNSQQSPGEVPIFGVAASL
jgi:hypothetical protein